MTPYRRKRPPHMSLLAPLAALGVLGVGCSDNDHSVGFVGTEVTPAFRGIGALDEVVCPDGQCSPRPQELALARADATLCDPGAPVVLAPTWTRLPTAEFPNCVDAACTAYGPNKFRIAAGADNSVWLSSARTRETPEAIIPQALLVHYDTDGRELSAQLVDFEPLEIDQSYSYDIVGIDLAVDASGNVAVALAQQANQDGGDTQGTVEVRRFDPNGVALEAARLSAASVQGIFAMRYDEENELLVVIDGGRRPGPGGLGEMAMVVEFKPELSIDWMNADFPGEGFDVRSAGVGADGRVTVGGRILRATETQDEAFFAQLDPDGEPVWQLDSGRLPESALDGQFTGDAEGMTLHAEYCDTFDTGDHPLPLVPHLHVDAVSPQGEPVWSTIVPIEMIGVNSDVPSTGFEFFPVNYPSPALDPSGRAYLASAIPFEVEEEMLGAYHQAVLRVEADGSACAALLIDADAGQIGEEVSLGSEGRLYYLAQHQLVALDWE